MKAFILISVICVNLVWSNGDPREAKGVGAFAYQDSAGNSASGRRFFTPPLRPIRPFQHMRRRAFRSNQENQRLAYNAARKAYDLTTNQAGYIPNFPPRFGPANDFPGFSGYPDFPGMPGFPGFDMSQFPNSAFAGAAVAPGFHHQIAAINPMNPEMPNVNKMNRFSETSNPGGQYSSVSASSYSSSSNVNGKETNQRGAETIINDNGKITKYKVHS